MIKAVIFDLGNVIVPVEVEKTLDSLASLCPHDAVSVRRLVATSEELRLHETGRLTTLELFDRLSELLSLTAGIEDFYRAWNRMLVTEPILPEELFRELSERYRLLALSDTNEIHFEFIRREFAAMQYFEDFVLSYEVGFVKPAPEMFGEAVRLAGCEPAECLFTDDKPSNIEGAIKCGLQAIHFRSPEGFIEELRDRGILGSNAFGKAEPETGNAE